jgi:hypothetical protein
MNSLGIERTTCKVYHYGISDFTLHKEPIGMLHNFWDIYFEIFGFFASVL